MAEPLDDLTKAYLRGWKAIQAEQDQIASNPAAFRRRARLDEMEQRIVSILDELDDETRKAIAAEMPGIYVDGKWQAATLLKTLPPPFTQIDQRAVQALSNDLFDDLLSQTEFVRNDTKRFIGRIVKDRILTGVIIGDSPAKTRKAIRDYLAEKGVGKIRYANGRRVRLDDYADMVIRTKRSLAATEGTLNFTQENGVEFVEVLDGPGCGWSTHTDGRLANGLVVSVDEARAFPLSHPRCRRTFGPRPGILTKAEADKAKPSITKEQIADQIEADELRKAVQLRATNARRRAERVLSRRESLWSARAGKVRV